MRGNRRCGFKTPWLDELENRTLLADGGTLGMVPGPRPSAGVGPNSGPADVLLVRFKDSTSGNAIGAALTPLGAHITRSFSHGPSEVVLGSGINQDAALAELRADQQVLYAEPDQTLQITATFPNE